MYSRPGFVDVTDEPGHHSRDQRAATRPGCGPGTRHGFYPVGLVNTRFGTERPKNAHTLTASTSDREGFVCVECPGSPSSSSAPRPPPSPPSVPTGSDGQHNRHEIWMQSAAGGGWLFHLYYI